MDYIESFTKKFETLGEHPNSNTKEWYVHRWNYYGADFGFKVRLKDGVWSLMTLEESGYSKSRFVIETLTDQQLFMVYELYSPTRDDYRTD